VEAFQHGPSRAICVVGGIGESNHRDLIAPRTVPTAGELIERILRAVFVRFVALLVQPLQDVVHHVSQIALDGPKGLLASHQIPVPVAQRTLVEGLDSRERELIVRRGSDISHEGSVPKRNS